MDENAENQGLKGAHPRAGEPGKSGLDLDQERVAKVGAVKAMAEAAMDRLAARIGQDEAEPEQPSLLLADPDDASSLFAGPVRHVANAIANDKRARGRPAGSQNRRSKDLANYLLSKGYRDPALNLADLANADPLGLAVEMLALPQPDGYSPQEVLAAAIQQGMIGRDELGKLAEKATKLVVSANSELMPYFHAKRPQEIHVESKQLGIMIVGEMRAEKRDDDGVMDLTRFDKPD
jgi:hypothetical protein